VRTEKSVKQKVGGDAILTQDPLREKASVTADAAASMQMHAKTMMDRTDDRVDAQRRSLCAIKSSCE
jgi:hypothetical protein